MNYLTHLNRLKGGKREKEKGPFPTFPQIYRTQQNIELSRQMTVVQLHRSYVLELCRWNIMKHCWHQIMQLHRHHAVYVYCSHLGNLLQHREEKIHHERIN